MNEMLSIPEPKPTIMTLGKNIGEEWTGNRIRRTPKHLSPWSEIGAEASGIAIEDKDAEITVFTVCNTAGDAPLSKEEAFESYDRPGASLKSEAEYMRDEFEFMYPHLKGRAFLQPRSWDTNQDAKEARKLIDNGEIDEDFLVLATIGFHLARAEMLFKKQGIKCNSIPTEDLIGRRDSDRKEQIINSDLYQKEQKKEKRVMLVQSIPYAADVISAITKKSRGIN